MRNGRPPSTCFRKTTWNSMRVLPLVVELVGVGVEAVGARRRERRWPRGRPRRRRAASANALRQRANGSRMGACEVPKRTNVSASAGSAAASDAVRVPVADGAAPRVDVRRDEPDHRAAPFARGGAVGHRQARLVDVPPQLRPVAVVRAAGVASPARTADSANSRSTRARAVAVASAPRGRAPVRARSASRTTTSTGTSAPISRDASRAMSAHVEAPAEARHDGHEHRGERRRCASVTPWVSRRTSTRPCSRSGTDDGLDGAQRGTGAASIDISLRPYVERRAAATSAA